MSPEFTTSTTSSSPPHPTSIPGYREATRCKKRDRNRSHSPALALAATVLLLPSFVGSFYVSPPIKIPLGRVASSAAMDTPPPPPSRPPMSFFTDIISFIMPSQSETEEREKDLPRASPSSTPPPLPPPDPNEKKGLQLWPPSALWEQFTSQSSSQTEAVPPSAVPPNSLPPASPRDLWSKADVEKPIALSAEALYGRPRPHTSGMPMVTADISKSSNVSDHHIVETRRYNIDDPHEDQPQHEQERPGGWRLRFPWSKPSPAQLPPARPSDVLPESDHHHRDANGVGRISGRAHKQFNSPHLYLDMVEAAQQRRTGRRSQSFLPNPPLWRSYTRGGDGFFSWVNGLRKNAERENYRQLQRQQEKQKQQQQQQQQQQIQEATMAVQYKAGETPPMSATVIDKAGVMVTTSSSYPALRDLNLWDRLEIVKSRMGLRFRYRQAYPRSPPPAKSVAIATTRPLARPMTESEKKRRLVRHTVTALKIMRFVPFLRFAIKLPSAQRLLRREEQAEQSASNIVVTLDGRRKRRRGRGAGGALPPPSDAESKGQTSPWDPAEEQVEQQPVVLSQYRMVKEPELGFLPIMPPPPSWLSSGFMQVREWVGSALWKRGNEEAPESSRVLPPPPSSAASTEGQSEGDLEGPKLEVSISLSWPFIRIQRGGEPEEDSFAGELTSGKVSSSSSASTSMLSSSDFFALSFPDPSSYSVNVTSVGNVGGSVVGSSSPTQGMADPTSLSRGSLLQEDMRMTGRDLSPAFPTRSAAYIDGKGSRVMPTTKLTVDLEDEEEEGDEEVLEGMTGLVTPHDDMERGIGLRRDSIKSALEEGMERSSLTMLAQVQTPAQFSLFLSQVGLEPLARLLSRPGGVATTNRILMREALQGLRDVLRASTAEAEAAGTAADGPGDVIRPLCDRVADLVPGLVDLVVAPLSSLRSIPLLKEWRTETMKEEIRAQAVAIEVLYALVLATDKAVEVIQADCEDPSKRHPRLTLALQQVLKERLWEEKAGSMLYATAVKLLAAVGHNEWVPRQPGQRGLRILSLDGGGTRGVMTIACLLEILKDLKGLNPTDLFDIICGTSTGGILACLFTVKGLSVRHAERMYDELIRKIFTKAPAPLAYSQLVLRTAQYNENIWEDLLKELLGETILLDTVAQPGNKDYLPPKMFVLSSILSCNPAKLFMWRNYNYRREQRSRYEGDFRGGIRDALRATTAAPTYFYPLVRQGMVHSDGALLANNPTSIAIHEAKILFPQVPIEVVVSVGTGNVVESKPLEGFGWAPIVNQLINSATNTEAVHDTLVDFLPADRYFRFNPIIENISIDETRPEKLQYLKDRAREFFAEPRNRERLDELVEMLRPQKPQDPTEKKRRKESGSLKATGKSKEKEGKAVEELKMVTTSLATIPPNIPITVATTTDRLSRRERKRKEKSPRRSAAV